MDCAEEDREACYDYVVRNTGYVEPTLWADKAFQMRGEQEDYDTVMECPYEDREWCYENIRVEGWAFAAFELRSLNSDADYVSNCAWED